MRTSLPPLLRALAHRNFRLFYSGQVVSLLGTWMQQVAMNWLVYRLTGSALMLGLVGFAAQFPVLLFAPFGGLWSDRFDKRRLLLASQSVCALQAVALAILTLSGRIEPWHLVALAAMLGLVSALDAPTRQSFVVHMVEDRRDLPNAIALNSFSVNAARLLGPTLAGLMVSAVGEGLCFVLNAASYLAVLVGLYRMRVPATKVPAGRGGADLRAGFAYTFGHVPMRTLLSVIATVAFCAVPYIVLMPVFAREVFHGDARTLGWLMGFAGIGALIGTLRLAARPSAQGVESVIAQCVLCAGIGLMGFAAIPQFWLAAACLVVAGFGIVSTVSASNVLIQSLVDDAYPGRVMSLFIMAFLGVTPLGNLALGALAEHYGVSVALFIGGAVVSVVGIGFVLRLSRLKIQIAACGKPAGEAL